MQNDKLWGFIPRYISWITVVLALLTIATYLAISTVGSIYYPAMMRSTDVGYGGGVPPMAGYAEDSVAYPEKGMMTPGYYPYPYPTDVPVGDTREFLKIYYNASMQTRDVPALTRTVETTVRGHEGRIDSQSSSDKYGSVSFSLPQSKYDAFRTELEGLVGSRFLSVNISSQNLLPQKVSIEEQIEQADTALADYKAARAKIVSAHAAAVTALEAKIAADEAQLALLRGQEATPQILQQIQTVSDDWNRLKQQLADENAAYASKLDNADANIKYAENWQKAVQTQDETLLENVATVNGTVSIRWISFWEMAQLFLPGYWIPSIFLALTILSFLRDRAKRRLSESEEVLRPAGRM